MGNTVQTILILLLLGLWVFVAVKWLFRYVKSRYGPVRTVKARVIEKTKTETFDKYKGNGKTEKFVVVFEIEGKRKGFYVSEFSYSGYRKGETGTLKYQGDRIIDFYK